MEYVTKVTAKTMKIHVKGKRTLTSNKTGLFASSNVSIIAALI